MRLDFERTDPALLDAVIDLCRRFQDAGGRCYIVGGSTRDALLGEPVQDFDLEVFGLDGGRVAAVLSERYVVDEVGESFGILKVRELAIDVALPRRESKTAPGHRGFAITTDPHLSIEEATARRDFTINAMLYDPLEDRLLDPFGGRADLDKRKLRHTSPAFSEDPLRVLRGMQLVARYELESAPETLDLCSQLDGSELARERVFEEWRKLLLLGRKISSGLDFLRTVGWLADHPELEALIGCEQDPEWHPEGDVWFHTLMVLDAYAVDRTGDDWEDLVVGFACLCHDLGKPSTTQRLDGRLRSRGHEAAGEKPTRSFMARLSSQQALVEEIVPLVLHHLKPRQLQQAEASDAAIRRLARKVKRIDRLARVAQADERGRPPLTWENGTAPDWLLERAAALDVEDRSPQPLVQGRHLIERGLEPGPDFGPLLDRCFEAQLDGAFTSLEEGRTFLDAVLRETGEGP